MSYALKIMEERDLIGRKLGNDSGYSHEGNFDLIPEWQEGVSHEVMGGGRLGREGWEEGSELDDSGWEARARSYRAYRKEIWICSKCSWNA